MDCLARESVGVRPTPGEWERISRLFCWGRRESETVSLVAAGMPRKAAAARLEISLSTLQTYLRRAMRKASVDDLIALVWRIVEVRDNLPPYPGVWWRTSENPFELGAASAAAGSN